MNFLDICRVSHYKNKFFGIVDPKIYSKWNEIDPMVLFFEGINQFAVKIAYLSKKLGEDKRYLPVQIRDIKMRTSPEYRIYKIIGSIEKREKIYKIDFNIYVYQKENSCATGSVYVSEILHGEYS